MQLSVNQSATLVCATGSFINLAGGAKYLIVPQFASGGITSGLANAPVAYQIGVPAAAAKSVASMSVATGPAIVPEALSLQQQLDRVLRARDRAAVSSSRWVAASANRASAIGTATAAVPDVGSLRDFRVLTGSNLQTLSSTPATARLAFVGDNILLYIDTLAPANGFSPSQLQAFGQYFDQTLFSIAVNAFGPPSDIDGNARVIMLLSPSVNGLTPSAQCASHGFIVGYFAGSDLAATTSSNRGEIFYAVVPDPNGSVSCAHSVNALLDAVPATFLHELQHLISFSQHVVVHGGQPEEGWLDEGLSIRAEELGSEYFETKYPAPSGRTNPSQLFPDSSQGFVSGFLSDSYVYLLRPDTTTLTLHSDSDDGLAWRGGEWALVHWLGDLKGKSLFTALDQSRNTGIANIAAAAGEPFANLFGDFSLALWTDSIPGIPRSAIPARNRLQSRNLRQIYQRLFDTNAQNSLVPRPYPVLPTVLTTAGPISDTLVPGGMAFYTLDLTSTTGSVAIRFATSAGSTFGQSLHPQVSVYRLPN